MYSSVIYLLSKFVKIIKRYKTSILNVLKGSYYAKETEYLPSFEEAAKKLRLQMWNLKDHYDDCHDMCPPESLCHINGASSELVFRNKEEKDMLWSLIRTLQFSNDKLYYKMAYRDTTSYTEGWNSFRLMWINKTTKLDPDMYDI